MIGIIRLIGIIRVIRDTRVIRYIRAVMLDNADLSLLVTRASSHDCLKYDKINITRNSRKKHNYNYV